MEEKRYTLNEARKIIQREMCLREGEHLIEQQLFTTHGGEGRRIKVWCPRCSTEFVDARWTAVQKPPEGGFVPPHPRRPL